jgi:predicted Zn-dependent peptidase
VALELTSAAGWPAPVVGATSAGLRLAALERPGPVVALRLTIGVGARHGTPGSAHMHEHLLFRTSAGASARRELERRGGEIGATTTREQVSIDAIVVPEDVRAALDVLARLAAVRATATDLERERDVVRRELAHEEEERRRIWQLQAESLFGPEHSLAKPILGTDESLDELGPASFAPIHARWRAGNAALTAVGPVGLDALLEGAGPILSQAPGVASPCEREPAEPQRRRHEQRHSRLLHLALGWRFDGIADRRLPALRLAEVVLAHGSGSRLYARLRTQRRLAYRISTVLVPYEDLGHLSAVTACDPHHARQAELAIVDEVERLASRGPSWQELAAAKRQLRGSLARAFESSRRLAGFAATQHLFGRLEPIEDWLGGIAGCGPDDVADAAGTLLRGGHAIASIGMIG